MELIGGKAEKRSPTGSYVYVTAVYKLGRKVKDTTQQPYPADVHDEFVPDPDRQKGTAKFLG